MANVPVSVAPPWRESGERSSRSKDLISGLRVALLPVLVVAVGVVATLYGTVPIPAGETIQILLREVGLPVGGGVPAWEVAVIGQTRLPEVVTALLIGASLSTAGTIFQALLRNPLADPFVIGTSSGAAFGVSIAFVASLSFAWFGFGALQIMAFVGSLFAVGVVWGLSRIGGETPVLTFLLAGFAVSTLMVAGMWLVAFEGGSSDRLLNWTMGSLADTDWGQITLVGPMILICIGAALFCARDLNALLLGEEQAHHLGLATERVKLLLIALAALLTALAVSVAGIIGFVGLVVPHIARLIYGPNHRALIPAAAMLGSTYLCLADLGARTLQGGGGEIPLGILTAVTGAPVFLLLLRRVGHAYRF